MILILILIFAVAFTVTYMCLTASYGGVGYVPSYKVARESWMRRYVADMYGSELQPCVECGELVHERSTPNEHRAACSHARRPSKRHERSERRK